MAELTKQALKVANNTEFPNNNNGAIAPSNLRGFNDNMIDSLVDEIAYNVDSASWNNSIDALEAFTSSQQPSFTALNAFTASQLIINSGVNSFTQSATGRLNNLEAYTASFTTSVGIYDEGTFVNNVNQIDFNGNGITASFVSGKASVTVDFTKLNAATASQQISINNLNTNSASVGISINNLNASSASQQVSIDALNSFTSSQSTASLVSSIDNLNASSASQQISIDALNVFTASAVGLSTGSLMVTASAVSNVITFTKGDNSTFNVTVADTTDLSSLNAFTASAAISITNLNASSASQQVSINNLNTTTASLLVETQNLELFSASALISISNLNASSASQQVSINSLNAATSSYVTSAITASSLITASAVGNVITFTKGDASTFNVSVVGAVIDTGSFATTASFNAYTQSNDQRVTSLEANSASVNTSITNINSATSSLFTSASLGLTTASFAAGTLTFTKGDNTTFGVVIPDVSGSAGTTIFEVVYTGENITKGDPLYISGSQGANPIVFKADAADPNKMPVTFVSNETIDVANTTEAIVLGLIEGIDLTGYIAGQTIYVAEGGGWSASLPSGSNSVTQLLGVVTKGGSGGKGLVLNPGPAQLPGLDSGKLWVGGANNQPIEITTASFASSASFNAYTSSNNQRVDSLESNSASVNISISNLNSTTQSLNTSVSNLNSATESLNISVTNLNASSASQQVSIDALNVFTASQSTASIVNSITELNTFSASALVSISNLNTNSASVNTSITNINSATSSLFTSASLGLVTASVSGTTLTFTKGDASTFNVTLPTGSGGGTIDTGSFAITGSNLFRGNQIVSGTFAVTDGGSRFSVGIVADQVVMAAGNADLLFSFAGDAKFSGDTISLTNTGSTPVATFRYTAGNDIWDSKVDQTGISGSYIISDVNSNKDYLTLGGVSDNVVIGAPLNVSGSLTASLQQGYVWVGDASGRTTTVATSSFGGGTIDTGSFATTGSNTFRGNQVLESGNYSWPNGFNITSPVGDITNVSAANTIQFITEGAAGPGGVNDIKFVNRVSGSSIIFENAQGGIGNKIDLYAGEVRVFAAAASGSNGRITIGNNTTQIDASNTPIVAAAITSSALLVNGNLTASLQEGYVWVGNASGVSTTVATSSFGGGSGNGFPFSGSAEITGSLSVSETVQTQIYLTPQTLTGPLSVPAGFNGMLTGPVSNSGIITIESGSTLVII